MGSKYIPTQLRNNFRELEWKLKDVKSQSVLSATLQRCTFYIRALISFSMFSVNFIDFRVLIDNKSMILTSGNCLVWCLCEWNFCCECILFSRWVDRREAGQFSDWIFGNKNWKGLRDWDQAAPWPWRWSRPQSHTTWSAGYQLPPASSCRTLTRCAAEGASFWCTPTWWQLKIMSKMVRSVPTLQGLQFWRMHLEEFW